MISTNITEYIRKAVTGLEYSCYICRLSHNSREGLEAHLEECQKFADETAIDNIKDPMIIWEGEDQIIANGKEATVVCINADNLPPTIHLRWNDDTTIRKYCRECRVFVDIAEFYRKATIDSLSEVCKLHEEDTPMPEELKVRQILLEKMKAREQERAKVIQSPPAAPENATAEIKKIIKKYRANKYECEHCYRTFAGAKYLETHQKDCEEIFDSTGLRWNLSGTFEFKGEVYTIVLIYTGRTRNKFTSPHVRKGEVTYKYCRECVKWKPLKDFRNKKGCWDGYQYDCKSCEASE